MFIREKSDKLVEFLVNVSRVTKVTKGGRRFSFSACVVLGDKNGMVGYGHGKAKEVGDARAKAIQAAKSNMIKVVLYQNRTIFHDVYGRKGSSKVMLRKGKSGDGIIAGGSMRFVFNAMGVKDIVAKSINDGSVYNVLSATFDALRKVSSPVEIEKRRS